MKLLTPERLDDRTRSSIELYRTALTNPASVASARLLHLLFRQNNVDLDYKTRRFNDAYTSGWGPGRPRNAGVIRIIDDSFPAYDREGPYGRDGIGSSFACHVTHRFVIARGLAIDRGWTGGPRRQKNITSDN